MDAVQAVPPPPDTRDPLSPTAAIIGGWSAFLANPWMSIGVFLVLMVVMCAGQLIPIVNLLFALLVAPALYAGGAWYFLRGLRGEKPTLETAFESFRRWPSVTGAVLILIGVSLLILVPLFGTMLATIGLSALLETRPDRLGQLANALPLPFLAVMAITYPFLVWWSARVHVVLFTVMEADRPGAVEAVRRAFALTRGSVWRIIGLYLLCIPVMLLGLLALCVGIVPASIVMYYSFAHAYEQLRARAA